MQRCTALASSSNCRTTGQQWQHVAQHTYESDDMLVVYLDGILGSIMLQQQHDFILQEGFSSLFEGQGIQCSLWSDCRHPVQRFRSRQASLQHLQAPILGLTVCE